MSNFPTISVIIPCYRQAHFLWDCIASLKAQTYPHWEAIIINDGSPDNTAEVASTLCASDCRIRYVEKQNGGLSSARNAGIEAAVGEWLQFLDADDLLDSTKFESNLKLVASSPNSVVIDDYRFLNEAGEFSTNSFTSIVFETLDAEVELAIRWETDLSIPVHSFLISAHYFSQHNLRFDENLPNHEDFDMWIRLFAFNPTLFFSGICQAVYRVGANSMTKDREKMLNGFLKALDQRLSGSTIRPELVSALRAKRRLTIHQYDRGWRNFLKNALENRYIRSAMPWRIQEKMRKWALLSLKEHQIQIKKKHFSKIRK